jgi:hypothetical protein
MKVYDNRLVLMVFKSFDWVIVVIFKDKAIKLLPRFIPHTSVRYVKDFSQ